MEKGNYGSKSQISKDIILQSALKMLMEKGYQEINIKTLSQKIPCSTQPIVWHFGNMEVLRTELGKYALAYANKKMCPTSSGIQAFASAGYAYVDIAFDEPNLFRYLYMSTDSGRYVDGLGFDSLTAEEEKIALVEQVACHFNIPKEKADTLCKNMIIYTHGLASLVAAGLVTVTKPEVYKMMKAAYEGFLLPINTCDTKQREDDTMKIVVINGAEINVCTYSN